MAYYGGGYGGGYGSGYGAAPGGNTFGGFPGGYNQTYGGAPNANFGGSSPVYTMGINLPNVDPNNYSGAIHFGPSSTYVGPGYAQFPAGGGQLDPYLGSSGGVVIPLVSTSHFRGDIISWRPLNVTPSGNTVQILVRQRYSWRRSSISCDDSTITSKGLLSSSGTLICYTGSCSTSD